jgi:hypothetical protein
MWHTVFVGLHAAAGTLALAAGAVALPAGRFFGVYRWSLIAMAAFLVPSLAVGWSGFDTVARVVFTGLLVLAVVMVVQGERAARIRPDRRSGPTAAYLDRVGFTLVALTDGFAVVAVLRAGAPGWLVALVAVGVAVGGHLAIGAAKARLTGVARPTSGTFVG